MCFRPPEFNKLMTKCPSCGTFNPPKEKKCKKCGADLPEPSAQDAKTVQASPSANATQATVKRNNSPQ